MRRDKKGTCRDDTVEVLDRCRRSPPPSAAQHTTKAMRIRVGLLLAVLLECGCAAYVHAPSRLTLPAAGACVRRSQQPMLAAVAQPESEDNLAAIFQRAVVGQDDAPAPRSQWTNYTLKPLGFLLAFVAASYTLVPMMFIANFAMYALWIALIIVKMVRAIAQAVTQRWRGLSMDMADDFGHAFSTRLAADDGSALALLPVRDDAQAEADDAVARMRAQTLQTISDE